jgi:uncharacterized protein YjiS (DUF1127 family)
MNDLIKLDNFTQFETTRTDATTGRPWIASIAAALWSGMRRRHQSKRAIAALSALDDRMLEDIGIFRRDIEFAVRHGRDKTLMR